MAAVATTVRVESVQLSIADVRWISRHVSFVPAITGSQLIYRSLRRRILARQSISALRAKGQRCSRHRLAVIDRDTIAFLGVCFGLTVESKRNQNQCTEVVLLAGGPRERALGLRILAAEGGRHRSLPGLRQRFAPDPACRRGRNLARLRRAARKRICAQSRT